jgi:hypothetical protein
MPIAKSVNCDILISIMALARRFHFQKWRHRAVNLRSPRLWRMIDGPGRARRRDLQVKAASLHPGNGVELRISFQKMRPAAIWGARAAIRAGLAQGIWPASARCGMCSTARRAAAVKITEAEIDKDSRLLKAVVVREQCRAWRRGAVRSARIG